MCVFHMWCSNHLQIAGVNVCDVYHDKNASDRVKIKPFGCKIYNLPLLDCIAVVRSAQKMSWKKNEAEIMEH